MYPETATLFKSLMPFGGELDTNNRWLKLAQLTPWETLNTLYMHYFCGSRGLLIKPCRLIMGLMIGKHILKMSDRQIVSHFHENPYFQYFCGMDSFMSGAKARVIHPSLLSKRRSRLGKDYFERFETEVLSVLVKAGLVDGKTVASDATVVPSHMEYPNDVKLMNVARSWLCTQILKVKNAIDPTLKIRTYAKTARRAYLNYQKRKKKSQAFIAKHKNKMLRFMKRNVTQLSDLLKRYRKRGTVKASRIARHALKSMDTHLKTAKAIYRQQREMVQKNTRRVDDRIVSFHQPKVRPMVRGKEGKPVEFGPKILLSWVGGFAVRHAISYDPFSENPWLERVIADCEKLLGNFPKEVLIDDGFSSHANRRFLAGHDIGHSLKLIGRSTPEDRAKNRKRRARRNAVEGLIGTLKNSFYWDKIRLRVDGGETIQTALTFGTHNLVRALTIA